MSFIDEVWRWKAADEHQCLINGKQQVCNNAAAIPNIIAVTTALEHLRNKE